MRSHTTGVLQWMSVSCLGGKRGDRVVVYNRQHFNCLEIKDANDRADSLWDSVVDQPTRKKRHKKYFIYSGEKSDCH